MKEQLRELKCGDNVLITWIDASNMVGATWSTEEEVTEWFGHEMVMESIGKFVSKSKKSICVCGDISKNEVFRIIHSRVMTVPIGCILKIEKLKIDEAISAIKKQTKPKLVSKIGRCTEDTLLIGRSG